MLIILVILLLIALIPLGVSFTYSERGTLLSAHIWLLRIKILPREKKLPGEEKTKKEKKKREKKPRKPENEDKKPPEKKGGSVGSLMKLIPPILDTLGRLRRKLTINNLTLIYTVGADDPYDGAMKYGRAWTGIGAATPLLENTFRIKNRDIEALISYEDERDSIFLDARLTLRVWEIIYIACGMLPAVQILLDRKNPADGKDRKNG